MKIVVGYGMIIYRLFFLIRYKKNQMPDGVLYASVNPEYMSTSDSEYQLNLLLIIYPRSGNREVWTDSQLCVGSADFLFFILGFTIRN